MNKIFNLLFFIKKNKIRTNGTAPTYLRITIDGKAADIASTRRNGMLKHIKQLATLRRRKRLMSILKLWSNKFTILTTRC
ncbi:hypothetical protein [Chryseobacterium sp. CFS15]|uniref:hypothetical protein n=1 Tax=Chryseobacterium sp. CFS15 TaxID=2986946 RepID=UPI0035BE63DE